MMKDKPTAKLTLLQVATVSSKIGKTKTNRKITNQCVDQVCAANCEGTGRCSHPIV
jgi:hypothetical protein